MGLISDTDSEKIRAHFEESLTAPVEIVMFTERESLIIVPGKQNCETCKQTEELLEEVVSLSDKLKMTVLEISAAKEEADALGIDRVPAFDLQDASLSAA
jgi:hypothetical protein